MALRDEFELQGEWLFRRRSYLPLVFVSLMLIAMWDYSWPFESYAKYQIWAILCFALSLQGLVIRCVAVGYAPAGTSGRNTDKQRANQLNTTGIYSLVRHPLYLGNFIIGFGVVCAPFVWWLPVMYCLLYCAYYERIMFAEEAFLQRKFGQAFDEWSAKTPAFIPALRRWQKPQLTFSFRNVLRREYTGLIVLILGNASIQFTEHLIVDHRIVYEPFWVSLLVIGSISYFVLKSLKKRTPLLDVPGRAYASPECQES